MDIFGTTVTVIHEIYTITVFIKGVVDDVRSYGPETVQIRQKLAHEFVYVDLFQSNFFDDAANAEAYKKQSKMLQADVKSILDNLKRVLAEYAIEAAKHGILADDGDPVVGQAVTQPPPSKKIRVKDRVRKFVDGAREDAKELNKKTLWSLFDKEKILQMLTEYSEWTNRLRQCSALMTERILLKGLTSFAEFADTQNARDLGLQDVAKRRSLVNVIPPATFTPLSGFIMPRSERIVASNVVIVKFHADDMPEPREVVLEHCTYSIALLQAIQSKKDATAIAELKIPYRKLAWTLNQSPFAEETDSDDILTATNPSLLTLRCIGYIDQPEKEQVSFLYELPNLGIMQEQLSVKTLHGLIRGSKPPESGSDTFFLDIWEDCWSRIDQKPSSGGKRKQSLRNRFFLAYALAMTVLNIHSSGWVHKDLWSHGIIIIPSSRPSKQSGSTYLIPYVAGWGVARPTAAKETDLRPDYSIEANLYRHPNRQQQPSKKYTLIHDLYSLGVLLMEIGVWDTVDNMFQSQIKWAKKQNSPPKVDLVRLEWRRFVKTEVERQMGEVYARAVGCCLLSDFGVDKDDDAETNLAVSFKNLVVDAIKPGITL
ncbi:uncharacterized protein A1O9_08363 [Exophiala aquamarina CBS 119918]|uniref:DUF7580 domain-containing protein n=1 Tax=Exophiala aquamarina CBS 119918 TaxID=1182545 RepID=A0A072P8K3_9EURO|nr:uncharacterized protein A1O9_08363 [Exophiala aquamarina CBS 119918]KEF55613.1 hypothetical protein A1O9_08363 [Exophiala aquamarina CBS 119918]